MVTKNGKRSAKRLDGKFEWKSKGSSWSVKSGRLVPSPGRPSNVSRIFEIVAEKLPFECLPALKKHIVEERGEQIYGVYLAHDSMGFARYGGRGDIFERLAAHKRKYKSRLAYFSFYTIVDIKHERDIETVILRAAGPQMILNDRKVALDIQPGNISDYEPGTVFFERRGSGS